MRAKGKKFKKRYLAIILILLVGGMVSWRMINAPLPTYQTLIVRPGDLEQSVLATGKLDALRKVDVGAQVSGQLKTLLVSIGDNVKKDQLLGVIDPDQAENQIKEVEATLMELNAERQQAAAELKLARVTLARQQQLAKTQAVSQQDLDTAATEMAVKQARIGTIDAQIKRNRASLDTAKTNLEYTRIVAPMAGGSDANHYPARTNGDCSSAGAQYSDAGGYEHHAGKSAGLGSGRDPSSGGAESMVHHCRRSANAL
ncbi:Macrolide-specific efflux protein MacA [Salmonella enterica subsp. enterica]|nr:Macrolide-specific efflux protein MacA [Salmonella enterica subsp. enterica]